MRSNYAVLFMLLNKRLFKKPSFVIILCMIPLVVFGIRLIAGQESGIVRIALVNLAKDSKDTASGAGAIIDRLTDNDSVFLYSECASEEEALKMLEIDSVDAVWIFPRDYDERVAAFTQGLITEQNGTDTGKRGDKNNRGRAGGKDGNAVTVIEREDTVLLQLARMELFGSMYSDLSYSLFENFIDLRIAGGEGADHSDYRKYYDNNRNSGSLFKYRDYDGNKIQDTGNGYLFTPVRGMLLLLLLLGGLAAAMYYRDDLDKEIFTWMPVGNRWIFEHVYLMTALIDGGLVVFVTFMITGLGVDFIRELVLMALYLLSSCCFCSIIRKITPGLRSLATLIPMLLLAMLVICPVFIYIRQLKILQLVCPPFYYLMADNNPRYLLYFSLYTAVIIVFDVLTGLGSRCSG